MIMGNNIISNDNSERVGLTERMKRIKVDGSDILFIKAIDDLFAAKALYVLGDVFDEDSHVLEVLSIAEGYSYNEKPQFELLKDRVWNTTFAEYILHFNKFMSKIEEDKEFGPDLLARRSLPLQLMFSFLFPYYKKNKCREFEEFLKLDYGRVIRYAIEKVPDSEKLLHFATDELPQNDSSCVHDKLWDIFSKTQSFWIPSEDVKNYIKNMRQSYVDLYIFGYSLLFVLAISHKKKEIKH